LVLSLGAALAGAEDPGALVPQPAPSSSGMAIAVPQKAGVSPRNNPDPLWGTSSPSIHQIHAYQFVPIDSTVTYAYDGPMTMRYRTNASGSKWFEASLSLPTGVKILGLEVYGYDFDAGDIYVWLIDSGIDYGGQVSSGTPSSGYFYYDLSSANITVDNYFHQYAIEILLSSASPNLKFRAVNVYYQLQVSPAPATATFSDVPTSHPFFQYVEALNASGITSGCSATQFCPDQPVTRGQMAKFLSKALGLHWPL
jgi:hypothetical protein